MRDCHGTHGRSKFCGNRLPLRLFFAAVFGTATAFTSFASHAQGTASGPITFAQILASPSDPQLNLDYAKQEARSGRLQQSAAALERLLLARPNWDSVRLFYGVVLYRLADMKGAIRELEVLDGRGLNAAQERDRRKYLALARRADSPLRITSRFSLGGRYDTNPNRIGDGVVDPDDDSDVGLTGSSRFRVEYDLESSPGSYLFFQTNGSANFFADSSQADFIGTRQKAGVTFNAGRFIISPYAHYGTTWLQEERFRSLWGGGVDMSAYVTDTLTAIGKYRFSQEQYELTDFSTIGNLRDGERHELRGGLRWRPTDRHTFTATGLWADKDARSDGFSYQRSGVRFNALSLLGDGWYVNTSIAATWTQYETFDNFYTNAATGAREDTRITARAVVGAPLSTLFAGSGVELPEGIADVVMQVGAIHSRQESNVQILDIANTSGEILFTKRFAF